MVYLVFTCLPACLVSSELPETVELALGITVVYLDLLLHVHISHADMALTFIHSFHVVVMFSGNVMDVELN